jgi:hypothetical protein
MTLETSMVTKQTSPQPPHREDIFDTNEEVSLKPLQRRDQAREKDVPSTLLTFNEKKRNVGFAANIIHHFMKLF